MEPDRLATGTVTGTSTANAYRKGSPRKEMGQGEILAMDSDALLSRQTFSGETGVSELWC